MNRGLVMLLLAVARAEQHCSPGCRLTDINIQVESCNGLVEVPSKMCEGFCYNKDLAYISPVYRQEQKTCQGDWVLKTQPVSGCAEGVTYPVARTCKCALCDLDYTFCGRYVGDQLQCTSN